MKSRIILASGLIILMTVINGCYLPIEERTTTTVVRENVQTEREYNVDDLNMYGQWINTPEYGRVWRPAVNTNWQPFYDGHWVYDGYEWVWASNEPYGQIVYHYGNWVYSDFDGWVWIPAYNKWSPARVEWRRTGDVVCWAPMPAKGARLAEPWENNNRGWSIVKTEDFNRENINARRIRNISSPGSFSRERVERSAPDVKVIERRTNQPVPVVKYDRGISRNSNAAPSTNTRQPEINRAPAAREVTKERTPDTKPAVREVVPAAKPAVKENTPAGRQIEREKMPEQKPAVREVVPANTRRLTPVQRDSAKKEIKLNTRQRTKTVAPAKAVPNDRERKVDAPEKKAETPERKADRQERER